jgi:DNA relaxase NicK
MGIHCVLSGQTCNNLRDVLPDILENTWMQGGKVTRFDLALDDLKGRVNAIDSRKHIKAGDIECRAREYPPAGDIRGGGQSQYCGKMSSECHVVIYDKDAEQGISGFRTRIEIRFKGRKADKAAKTYLQSQDCRGLILGFVKFPKWAEWNEVFSTKPIKVNSEKTRSRRVLWLLGQVSKSIALEISERGGDLEILSLIKESVMAHLSDLRQSQDD